MGLGWKWKLISNYFWLGSSNVHGDSSNLFLSISSVRMTFPTPPVNISFPFTCPTPWDYVMCPCFDSLSNSHYTLMQTLLYNIDISVFISCLLRAGTETALLSWSPCAPYSACFYRRASWLRMTGPASLVHSVPTVSAILVTPAVFRQLADFRQETWSLGKICENVSLQGWQFSGKETGLPTHPQQNLLPIFCRDSGHLWKKIKIMYRWRWARLGKVQLLAETHVLCQKHGHLVWQQQTASYSPWRESSQPLT